MRVSISVTLSKEIDLPDCTEIVASCTLKLEAEHSLLRDMEALQHIASCALMVCHQAIDDVPPPQSRHDDRTGPVTAVNGSASKRR
jgi:hypothetical protein